MNELVTTPRAPRESAFALQFFAATFGVFAVAAAIARGLVWISGDAVTGRLLPPVFLGTTVLLLVGSLEIHRAVAHVRRERQRLFRQSLLAALAVGTLFVGVQSYGMWWLLRFPEADDPQTGVKAFVFMLTYLHAMHFTVAMGFLVFITLRALRDRYDHEYYWGVKACGYVWHFLGAVWIAILAVYAIASL